MAAAECLHGAWVAVYVRSNHERTVAEQLQVYGYEQFLPTYVPASATGKAQSPCPLFPGYVFCRYLQHPACRIVQVPGVVRILSCGGAPAVLSEDEIGAIRRIITHNVRVEPWRGFEVGQRVRLVSGPLQGIAGTLIDCGRGLRMIVSVTMLRRAVAVHVTADQLIPLAAVASSMEASGHVQKPS